jgi:hypothetical protein
MKKIILIIPIIMLGLAACEKQLDQAPISQMSIGGFFRNDVDFDQAVSGVYNSLRGYPSREFYLSDVRSDNIYGVGAMGVRDHEPINNFAKTISSNVYMSEAWNSNYTGILRANTVLDNLNNGNVSSVAVKNRMEAEVRFLRAFYYFDLVRIFGKVPKVDRLMTPLELLTLERAPVADIYDLIISDLNFAITNLDEYYAKGTPNCGRATKNAARGILARVYLTRSGPTYDIEGPGLATKDYGTALGLLNDVIISAKYSTLSNYASIFAYNNENNAEVVWDIQFMRGGGAGADFPGEFSCREWWNSVNIPWDIGLENKDVSEALIAKYDQVKDKRFAATVLLGYINKSTHLYDYDPGIIKYSSSNPADWGASRTDFPINYIVLRYADILLMKAECILQGATGTQTEVNTIVNDIRTRAGIDPLPGNVTLDNLLAERQLEFLGEGQRWGDLVRTGKVLNVMNAWIPIEDIKGQMAHTIDANMIIYPVPQSQIDVKKGLYKQNLGYN